MKSAENILMKRGNKATLKANDLLSQMFREQGKEAVAQLKRDNYNIKLEDCVIGADQRSMVEVIDGYIVGRTGLIFMTPRNHCGRAPFYSSKKLIGDTAVPTLYQRSAVDVHRGYYSAADRYARALYEKRE